MLSMHGGVKYVLRGVSLRLSNKHIILGPNGSGKTTLFRAIAGLVPTSSGRILIDGLDVRNIYGIQGTLSCKPMRGIKSVRC